MVIYNSAGFMCNIFQVKKCMKTETLHLICEHLSVNYSEIYKSCLESSLSIFCYNCSHCHDVDSVIYLLRTLSEMCLRVFFSPLSVLAAVCLCVCGDLLLCEHIFVQNN